MNNPSALQRLAAELKTFDWHYDPNSASPAAKKAKRQEAKIKRIIAKCKQSEVRELWDRLAPTAKFPTPFGLKPRKAKKVSDKLRKGESLVHPTQAYKRRQELNLPDPSGEMKQWELTCRLLKAASLNDCTIPELVADPEKLKAAGLEDVIIPQRLVDETERDRKNYATAMLNDQALDMMADAVMKGDVLMSDIEHRYGEQFCRKVKSAIGRIRDKYITDQYAAAASRNSSSTASTGQGATKGTTMDKNNPTNKSAGVRGSRYELFGQPATAVLRWMGSQGWDFAKARKAINELGFPTLSDSTVRCQVGGWTYRGEPASLTPDQVAQVNAAGGVDGSATKASKGAKAKAKNKANDAKASKAPSKPAKASGAKGGSPTKAKADSAGKGQKQAPSKASAKANSTTKASKASPKASKVTGKHSRDIARETSAKAKASKGGKNRR